MSLQKLEDILRDIGEIEDYDSRMDLLIEFGQKFKAVEQSIANKPYPEQFRISGCESEAYLFPCKNEDGTLNFHFAVENPQGISAKALAFILESSLSGEPIADVVQINEQIAYDIFGKNLSMGKGLGLTNMIRAVKDAARNELTRVHY